MCFTLLPSHTQLSDSRLHLWFSCVLHHSTRLPTLSPAPGVLSRAFFICLLHTQTHTHTHIHTPSSSSLFVDLPFALFFVSFFFLWLLKGGHQACVRGCWSAPAKEAQGLADCQGDPHPYAAALRCSALLFASVKCVCVCVHTFVLK